MTSLDAGFTSVGYKSSLCYFQNQGNGKRDLKLCSKARVLYTHMETLNAYYKRVSCCLLRRMRVGVLQTPQLM